MGGREVGGMANLLSAHRDLANPEHRAEVARLWDVDDVPATPGKTAVELFEAVKSGEIKALWIACTNPAQSMPEQTMIRAALGTAEFVVLQEAFRNTETADYADLILPASTWGEKEGTVTNSERCITHVRRAVVPPGEARPDWQIARDFALRLGQALKDSRASRLFPYFHPEQIFREHAETTRGRDLDIGDLDYAVLDSAGPQQWPFPRSRRHGRAPVHRRPLRNAERPRTVHQARHPIDRREHRRAPSAASEHRPPARPVARHEPHRQGGAVVQPRR